MRLSRLLAAAVVLVAACTDDDSAAPPTTDAAATTGAATTEQGASETTAAADTTAAPSTAPPTTAPPTTAPPSTLAPAPGYPPQPPDVPYPGAEWPMGELPPTVDRAIVDAAVDVAFGAPDAEGRVRSVVVVQGGEIVYERYHPLDGPEHVNDSYSVAKSFTSALIGMLVDDGLVTLDEHPAFPEWQAPGDPRQAITVRQMLQMSSGLEWTEEYGPGSLAAQMFAAQDAAALMAAQPLESEPGSTFEYSTGTSALLVGLAADELGSCAAVTAYLEERLFDPIGITSETLVTDGGGCWFGGFGADMTTRDFARFGLLYLRGGQWDGRQLIATSWIDETRLPAATNPQYGLHWWMFQPGVFSAEGLFGQRIVVVPSLDLVVAANSTSGGDPYTMVGAILGAFGLAG